MPPCYPHVATKTSSWNCRPVSNEPTVCSTKFFFRRLSTPFIFFSNFNPRTRVRIIASYYPSLFFGGQKCGFEIWIFIDEFKNWFHCCIAICFIHSNMVLMLQHFIITGWWRLLLKNIVFESIPFCFSSTVAA